MKIWDWLLQNNPAAKRERENNLRRWEKNREVNLHLLQSIIQAAPEGSIIVIQQDGEALESWKSPADKAERYKKSLKAAYEKEGQLKAQSVNRDFMAFFADGVTPEEIEEELVWTDVIERFWIFEQ